MKIDLNIEKKNRGESC